MPSRRTAPFSVEIRHPVEVGANEEAHLVQWLSKRLGHQLIVPDPSALGFRLMGGRLLPADSGPAALFMYEDGKGTRLTCYYLVVDVAGETEFQFREQNGISAFYWVEDGLAYAIAANVDRNLLLKVAEIDTWPPTGREFWWLPWSRLSNGGNARSCRSAMDRAPQTLAPARKPRHHRADGHSQYTRRLLVGEVFDAHQQQRRPLLLRQCREGAQQIPMLQHRMLPAVDRRADSRVAPVCLRIIAR
jgi:hypothetical protein